MKMKLLHTMEMKKLLLIILISFGALVIIIFWHQMGGVNTNGEGGGGRSGGGGGLLLPNVGVVLNTVRKIYSPGSGGGRQFYQNSGGEPRWTWKCEKQRCERYEWFDGDVNKMPLQSQSTCAMLCGSLQLWPRPTGKVTLGTKTAIFTPDLMQLDVSTNQEPALSLLQESYAVFNSNINALLPNLLQTKNTKYDDESTTADDSKSDFLSKLLIKISVTNSESDVLLLNTDESYKLKIHHQEEEEEDNRVKSLRVDINAKTFFGARHALETLSQLIWYDEYALIGGYDDKNSNKQGVFLKILRTVNIVDKPEFAYRGLMLDTARNFIPLEDIKRTLDGMSAVKLNAFHWHVSDSQSFPLILPSVPELAQHGAYSPNMVYHPQQVKELIRYAKVRGIRVIIEIDTPAHAGNGWEWGPSANLGELAVCVNQEPWSLYCGEPPCGQLNPENPHVYDILEKIYSDLIEMGTDQEIFHLGGDEVNTECWTKALNTKPTLTNSNANSYTINYNNNGNSNYTDMHDLWGEFTLKAIKRLESAFSKKIAVNGQNKKLKNILIWWSNLSKRPYLQKYLDKEKVVVQSWGASQWLDTQDLLADGYRVLLSHVDAWYLDCGFGKWRETGDAACDPYRPWQTMYTHRPWIALQSQVNRQIQQLSSIPALNVKELNVKNRIIGGEVCLWTEQVEASSLDARIFPRAAAFAERMWSDPDLKSSSTGSGSTSSLMNNYDGSFNEESIPEDVYTRLSTQRDRLVIRGITAEAMWPRFCANNPGKCL